MEKKELYRINRKKKLHEPIVENANKLGVELTGVTQTKFEGEWINIGTMKLKGKLFEWLVSLKN